ncbi:hypothetical protein J6590_000005 [Homalodisca vitripennis]|nr:hypothetical protein J6590_000005 [Homalodisca vitripennis]
MYPNIEILLRMFLSTLVTKASAERDKTTNVSSWQQTDGREEGLGLALDVDLGISREHRKLFISPVEVSHCVYIRVLQR